MYRPTILCSVTLVVGLLILTGCYPSAQKIPATQALGADATEKAKALYDQGASLYVASCNRCHQAFAFDHVTVDRWESILPKMIDKAGLDQSQGQAVTFYVMSNVKPKSSEE